VNCVQIGGINRTTYFVLAEVRQVLL